MRSLYELQPLNAVTADSVPFRCWACRHQASLRVFGCETEESRSAHSLSVHCLALVEPDKMPCASTQHANPDSSTLSSHGLDVYLALPDPTLLDSFQRVQRNSRAIAPSGLLLKRLQTPAHSTHPSPLPRVLSEALLAAATFYSVYHVAVGGPFRYWHRLWCQNLRSGQASPGLRSCHFSEKLGAHVAAPRTNVLPRVL